jgi:hypothetical protein
MSRKHYQNEKCVLVFSRTVTDATSHEIATFIQSMVVETDSSDSRTEWFVVHEKDYSHIVTETVSDSAWTFKPEFLAKLTGHSKDTFEALSKTNLCERLNELYVALISHTCGIKKFIDAAVDADGVGHFLSSFDSQEHEYKTGRTTYYIYRSN